MAEYDAGFKIAAHVSGQKLALLANEPTDHWAPIVSEVQTTERFSDRAFRARRGRERFVVYMEAYTYWKKSALWSVLAKSGMLSERERLPTVSIIFILHPRGYRSQSGQFQLSVSGRITQRVTFHEVCLWNEKPQKWWEHAPGLMALYPLCHHERSPTDALTYSAGIIKSKVSDTVVRANLLTSLGIFGTLAYPDIDPKGIIGSDQMKESPFYQRIVQEGEVKAQRAYILKVLRLRFGAAAADEFTAAVNGLENSGRLEKLLDLAVVSPDITAFRNAFTGKKKKR